MIRKIKRLLHSLTDRYTIIVKKTKWKIGDNQMKRIIPNREIMSTLMQSNNKIKPWQTICETNKIDEEAMEKLGLTSGTHKDKTYLIAPETKGDINIILDTYWALINKTIPQDSLFIKAPIAFRKEIGDDLYKELEDILANDREEYEIRVLSKLKGEKK